MGNTDHQHGLIYYAKVSKKLTVRQLLLLALLLAGLVPAMLISFLSFFQAKAALNKEIKHDMHTLSQALANDVAGMIQERVQNVHSWSSLSIMQEAKIGDVDKRLSIFLKELGVSYNNTYINIYVIDSQRNIIASSNSIQISRSIPLFKHWFDIDKSGKILKVGEIEGNVLPISAQLTNLDGQLDDFFIVAEFNWKHISTILNNSAKSPTAAALISDKQSILAKSTNWEGIGNAYTIKVMSEPINSPLKLGWTIAIEKLHSVATAPSDRLGWIFLILLITSTLFAALLVKPIASMITSPLTQLTEFAKTFKDRRTIHLEVTGPREVQTLSNAFNSMMQDLARYELDLTRAAKLAVAGEMATAMSHEIRTPLGILRSSAELLGREKNLSPEAHEVLGFILSETERLNKLVNTLIDVARPRQPSYEAYDVNQLLTKCIALLSAQAKEKNIRINYKTQPEVIALIDVDQITQVFMNLIMNAIQVLPNDGQVSLSLLDSMQQVIIQVEDDGPGITIENQAKIFEPFFTQRSGGVGLGLAIVKQIVQSHHGDIRYAHSKMGGAQFTITFPKKRI